jgi:hypothetical protein
MQKCITSNINKLNIDKFKLKPNGFPIFLKSIYNI